MVPLDRSNEFAALWGAFGYTVQAFWQDGEGGRLERFVPEIAGEVVTGAEISYSYRQLPPTLFPRIRMARTAQGPAEGGGARQHQLQVDAKSANHGGNSNRPELIGCSMKPHRCDARLQKSR